MIQISDGVLVEDKFGQGLWQTTSGTGWVVVGVPAEWDTRCRVGTELEGDSGSGC